jgi:outer membrane protein assembly complex protein YaeT
MKGNLHPRIDRDIFPKQVSLCDRGSSLATTMIAMFCGMCAINDVAGQTALSVPRPEEKDKAQRKIERQQEKRAQRTTVIEFQGARVFDEKELRSQLKDQIITIDQYGLTPARGDDVAFFLELFYRKHGYAKVDVRYVIEPNDRLRLVISEGPLVTLAQINFVGNAHEPTDKLFEYVVGPTRERYSKLQKKLPFVAADVEEGVDLVHRQYVADGFLDSVIDPPIYQDTATADQVDVTITIHEGRQYFFGRVSFAGDTIYGDEALRGQMLDLLNQPYTDARVADIPRRLQTYFKTRGYYAIKVDAIADPLLAVNGHVPVRVTIEPGPVYTFDGVTVNGLDRLRPGYLVKRFRSLNGKTYSPDVLDERFREIMRTGLFNVLQIKPTPIGGNQLRLDISAEEAKSKEFGFSIGYGSYTGGIFGVQYRDRDLFGYGRPLTTSLEYSQRGYKGEILYEDPFFLDTDNLNFRARLSAITYDFDGYSKFELGARVELTRKITKKYEAGLILSARHVEVTSTDIDPLLIGPTNYFVSSIGLTHTLDLRDNPVNPSRGLIANQTVDFASGALGSGIDFIRSTVRFSYYLPFSPPVTLDTATGNIPTEQSWFSRSALAFGARAGIIHSLGDQKAIAIPIDERFFSGGSTTVRSFAERDLGPHDRGGHPIGGEFFSIFNVEYTFPLYGELQGAVFVDAGNLLPNSADPFASVEAGFDDMRYAVGLGLRYKLPIGPIRVDYGVNPAPRADEDFGAFHFSFGFAF